MKVELLYFPGCPNVDRVRDLLRRCLSRAEVTVEETVADFPSPTVRVDGVDVMGEPAGCGRSCRLDIPTKERLLAALKEAHVA